MPTWPRRWARVRRKTLALALFLGGTLLASPGARADFITFTGSGNDGGQGSGTNLAASVTFDLSGTTLKVTLQNTTLNSVGGVWHNADVLTAVYWNSASTSGATPVSAALGAGSTLVNTGGTAKPPPLGSQWEYATTSPMTYAGVSINQGIGSSGLDIFGSGNFSTPGNHLDGSGWGIISTSDTIPADGALNTSPFVQDTVVFSLTVPQGTTLDDVDNVVFQFGTSSSEPSFQGHPSVVPEPPAALLVGIGVLGLGALGLWRRRRGLAVA
jgi:MYXO-CTERM domain-containing protein